MPTRTLRGFCLPGIPHDLAPPVHAWLCEVLISARSVALTLAEILQDAGYRTYGIGSHSFLKAAGGLQQGFSGFDDELMRDPDLPGDFRTD